jgi:hypothetical protein
MSRPLGTPKTGGRVRGTPNKRSADLLRKLKRMGCDPLEGLARIALDPQTDVVLKVRCFSELAQYVYSKRKAIDVTLESPTVTRVPELSFGNLPLPKL